MTEAEKAYQYFVIAVPENEEQAKAYFWARKALQPTLTQPNEPLTLEELREMDGEPVWVENKNNPALSGWGIMLENICSAYHDIFSIEQYNKTWLAYRRPPEGEEES